MSEQKVLLTFYALAFPRGTRIPVGSLDRLPTDWIEVKTALTEAMRQLYIERKQNRAIVFLERHLPGKFAMKTAPGTYIEQKMRYKRQPEAVFRAEYNPLLGSLEKVQAAFSEELLEVASGYWDMERKIRWRTPPIIPRDHKSFLEDPKQILKEPSATRYADYSRTPKNLYGYGGKECPYPARYNRTAKLEYDKRAGGD